MKHRVPTKAERTKKTKLAPSKDALPPNFRTLPPAVRAGWWQARCNDSEYTGPHNPQKEAIQAWGEAAALYDQQGQTTKARCARAWIAFLSRPF